MKTIKEARSALGMTQEEFAAALGVTQGTVSQWEIGRTHPSFGLLPKIADVLQITLDELIKQEEKGA